MLGIDTQGRFQILEAVQEGAIYRAMAPEGEVALHVLRGASAQAALRFKHAARTHERLAGPGLRAVHEHGVLPDGSPYAAFEPLRPLPRPVAAEALQAALPDLARALGRLHAAGFIHGELGPEALGVAADGAIKLQGPGRLQRAGEPAAAPVALAYAAPEAVRGLALDQRADVFALGATLYGLLTGRPPYEGADVATLLRAYAVPPAPPPALAEPLMAMIAPEPAARPRSMAAVLGQEEGEAVLLTTRFVGRTAQLAAFGRALQDLRAGTQTVTGPAGAGRTRFLAECRVLAQVAGVPFLHGRADGLGAPYGVMASVLGRANELPALGAQGEHSGMEPRDERVALQSAIAELILKAAGPRGAVLALDDWDQADAGSRETLAYLQRNARGIPLLVLLTAREAPDGEPLAPLTAAEMGELLASGLGTPVPAAFAAALAGYPGPALATVEQILRAGVQGPPGTWEVPEPSADAPLGADAGRVAEALAVAGADADLPMLADLAGLEEEALFAALYELQARHRVVLTGEAPAFASKALAEAAYAGIPAPRRVELHAAVAEQLELRTRAGAMDAAGQTSLARHFLRSRQLERALSAAFLAADFNMDVFAADTARELLREGLALMDDLPGQHDHWRCAFLGRLAAVERWRGDFQAMGACLDQAIPLAERLRENETLARLLVLQGACFNQQMTGPSFRRATEVLQRAAGLMASGSLVTQTRCRYYLGQAYFYLGRGEEARTTFEEAARLAKRASLPFWEAKSLAFVGYLETVAGPARREGGFAKLEAAEQIQVGLGDRYGRAFTAALLGEALAKAMRLPEAEAAYRAQVVANEELGVIEDLAAGLTNLAHVQALAGRLAPALETCRQAVELAARADQPVVLLARSLEGWIMACLGRLGEAEALLAACTETSGYMFTHSAPILLSGWLRLGRLDLVRSLGQEALVALRTSPDPDLQAQVWALLAEAHVRLGELDTGGYYARRAWEAVSGGELPLARYMALRTHTSLALAHGDLEAALAHAREALDLARRAGARAFEAESERLLGIALLTAGEPGAGECFRAVQAFAEREDLPYLRAVAAYGLALAGDGSAGPAREALLELAEGLTPETRQAFLTLREVARVVDDRAPLREGEVLPALLRRLGTLASAADMAREVALAALALVDGERAGVWVEGGCLVYLDREKRLLEAPAAPPEGPSAPLVAAGRRYGAIHVKRAGPTEPGALASLAMHVGLAIAYARSLPS